MNTYEHSVLLSPDKCIGCTTCVRHCPTEAIRIRDGRAVINQGRCIDCGECIRTCPQKAKKAVMGKLSDLDGYRWKIALPAPALYGQFENLDDVEYVLDGLLHIGFDDVYEVSQAAELLSAYTRAYLNTAGVKKPVISTACPAVARLISLRFPSLEENVLRLLPPIELAAKLAREKAQKEHPDLKPEEIGICFISPCPAKASYVKNGFGDYKSQVDVVIPITDVYFQLINAMGHSEVQGDLSASGRIGVGWATSGGEASALFNDSYLAADGIENVIRVLDQIENGNIAQMEFVELNACPGGCVGGVLTVQNPFIARARLHVLRRYMPVSRNSLPADETYIPADYFFEELPEYQPISQLSDSIAQSMRMMAEIQNLRKSLPGVDCAACGAPTCRAFAEDVVRGNASMDDCILCRVLPREEKRDDR
ncbi:MAG: 4Fe-4S dicluster domain-containing protein [Ruminococcaceae bacterium]|nr:4Fe-4S dicluster domain-containing protein [Oscillospiraceae bacterium]